jgi:hypothetical protein
LFASSLSGELVVAVGADHVGAIELSGLSRERVRETRLPLKIVDGQPQFDALAAWIEVGKARRLTVRLSSAWVRFALLPWQNELADEALALGLARALFQEQYGETSVDWRISLSPLQPGCERVASAIDTRWFDALSALADQCSCKLQSMEPIMTAVYNRIADKLPNDALLAVVEPRRLVLLQIEGGRWAKLYNRVLPEPWQRRLPGLITQASAALDALSTPLFIAAPQFEREDLGRLSATWLRLPPQRGFDPRRDRDWAFCAGC